MKDQGDWAFAAGINRFMYHTFQSQTLNDSLRPGMTMGPYGVHWNRSQTWWPMIGDYHRYIARCQYVLRQGRSVADILYLTPEGAPHVFRPPYSALAGDSVMPDRRGYNFDGCAPGQLTNATVAGHQIVFPGGAAYRLLVLPAVRTMTPALLEKIASLIREGATVIGCPPVRSPGLSGYPQCDDQVRTLATSIWGGLDIPAGIQVRWYGKGKVIWGTVLADPMDGSAAAMDGPADKKDGLYPSYALTAQYMDVPEDFSSDGPIRYTHRTGPDWDIYFVASRSAQSVNANCRFRSEKGVPELWDPLTGKSRTLPEYAVEGDQTTIPLQFAGHQSYLIVFRKETSLQPHDGKNFPSPSPIAVLNGPWEVAFDPKWGGPQKIRFDSLVDWTARPEDGIKYYSGIAAYRKTFDLPKEDGKKRQAKGGQGTTEGEKRVTQGGKDGGGSEAAVVKGRPVYLDLGEVRNMARVWLNGKDLGVVWTAPWRVNITDALKQKGNQLTIEVVNLWPNRLIGDERLPDDGIKDRQWPQWLMEGKPRTSGRYTFTTYKHYTKDSPLLSSGLIGPVRILR
jgi:hypothetical protein